MFGKKKSTKSIDAALLDKNQPGDHTVYRLDGMEFYSYSDAKRYLVSQGYRSTEATMELNLLRRGAG